MNKKIIGILIIIIGLIALVGVVYFVFFYKVPIKELITKDKTEQVQKEPTQTQPQQTKTTPQTAVIDASKQPQLNRAVTEGELKQIALSFAERFGSYSNQSNYGNIKDLKIFMSLGMKAWADKFIQEEIAKNTDTRIYIGMTTKAVSSKVKQFDDDIGKAEIIVSAQRRMSTGSMSNAVSYRQDIIINFVKENEVWKVDSAYWQEVLRRFK